MRAHTTIKEMRRFLELISTLSLLAAFLISATGADLNFLSAFNQNATKHANKYMRLRRVVSSSRASGEKALGMKSSNVKR
jgi:hypothetical protein